MNSKVEKTNYSIVKQKNSYYELNSIDIIKGTVKFNIFLHEKGLVKNAISIKFKSYVSFRIVEESYLLNYFDDSSLERFDILLFEESNYKRELELLSSNYAVSSSKGKPNHYGIFYLVDDCIEVVSYDTPIISYGG